MTEKSTGRMMKMKKKIVLLLALFFCGSVCAAGCAVGNGGKDGDGSSAAETSAERDPASENQAAPIEDPAEPQADLPAADPAAEEAQEAVGQGASDVSEEADKADDAGTSNTPIAPGLHTVPLTPVTPVSPGTPGTSDTLTDENGMEYSASTLIVYLRSGTDEETAESIAAAHGLQVVYHYSILSGMAVKTESPRSAKQLDALIAALEKEDAVVSVSRDYVTRLDDPVMPIAEPELMG